MKNLFLFLAISTLSFKNKNVYVCNGPKSIAYHSTNNCRGLKNCSTVIREITLNNAIKKGRRACLICKPPKSEIYKNTTIKFIELNKYAYSFQ